MRLTMLGTGHAMPQSSYNTCYVLSEDDFCLLVDGGGGYGLKRQLDCAHISLCSIHHAFVTHKHLDHLMGIIWLMRMVLQMMVRGTYEGDLTIYAHDEVTEILTFLSTRLFNTAETAFVGSRLVLCEVHDGDKLEISGHTITFFDIGSVKAKQFGYRLSLKEDEFLVCFGDEPVSEAGRPYGQGATWMLAEAFCLESDAMRFHPEKIHHSTVASQAANASKLGVKNLVLYHMEDTCLSGRAERVMKEASLNFSGTVFAPYDLDVIDID